MVATACIGNLDHYTDLMDERHPLSAHVKDESTLVALLATARGANTAVQMIFTLIAVLRPSSTQILDRPGKALRDLKKRLLF